MCCSQIQRQEDATLTKVKVGKVGKQLSEYKQVFSTLSSDCSHSTKFKKKSQIKLAQKV